MDKDTKNALLYRLNWILKYAEEGRLDNIKEEVNNIVDELNNYDLVVPF
ncbi:TPA: hypothetical protein PTW06_003611 [Clostridium botulinum]|nr:hypothetical protein [Clostridium botulinum]HDK7226282.1 hypothetical protein [Clostridium botulinum]HDK7273672.1 hypothetical protein [Clostridium botulinum]HDK7307020.1 hypothetical protein [Clostridium botulinum]HDK7314656.1 hypothetical protein [Clostridium botulinum]